VALFQLGHGMSSVLVLACDFSKPIPR
jgi:hypothetical protein